jgi:hypothetical protein
MEGLGISPKRLILPNSPLFALFMAFAPTQPMDVYMIASKYDLHDLAVSSSSHLLSYPLSSITDSMAAQLGPVYLKRLFFLHMGRSDALKRILLEPPQVHGPTSNCDFTDQKAVTRAWCLASAYLAFEVRPGRVAFYINFFLAKSIPRHVNWLYRVHVQTVDGTYHLPKVYGSIGRTNSNAPCQLVAYQSKSCVPLKVHL